MWAEINPPKTVIRVSSDEITVKAEPGHIIREFPDADWPGVQKIYTEWTGATVIEVSAAQRAQIDTSRKAKKRLGELDLELTEIGEDLIDVLISKGVITLGDLPVGARNVYNEKKSERAKL